MATKSSRSTPSTARARAAQVQPAKPLKPSSPPPVPKDNPIKVRATAVGYYDHVRRREGDVFVIANEGAFSEKWMEVVDPRTRERVTTAKQALEQKHDELIGGRSPAERANDESVLED